MQHKIILETDRTILREMTADDFDNLCTILQDEKAMYAYEHAFGDDEVQDWLDRNLKRYAEDGFGLWMIQDKQTGGFIGQCGLTLQQADGRQELEIGYLLRRDLWGNGYAIEAAMACRDYARNRLGAKRVVSIIRDNNEASKNVARRMGMQMEKIFVKHYYGVDMPHEVFVLNMK